MDILSQKCSIWLLEIFAKVYQNRHQHSTLKSSVDDINTYVLPSLGYEVTDRHLPRGFVTSKKPDTSVLCDSAYCDKTFDLYNGIVLACGHGYHNDCLQKSHFKCFICLGYLQDEIQRNVNALRSSMTNKLVESELFEKSDNTDDDDLDEAHEIMDDLIATGDLLKYVKLTFLNL